MENIDDTKTFHVEFTNQPKLEELDHPDATTLANLVLPKNCLCPACEKPNMTPFKVTTCSHVLCGPCWQMSACNIGGRTNQCLVCAKPTQLLCFRSYDNFVGYNICKGMLMGASDEINTALDAPEVSEGAKMLAMHNISRQGLVTSELIHKELDRKFATMKRKLSETEPSMAKKGCKQR